MWNYWEIFENFSGSKLLLLSLSVKCKHLHIISSFSRVIMSLNTVRIHFEINILLRHATQLCNSAVRFGLVLTIRAPDSLHYPRPLYSYGEILIATSHNKLLWMSTSLPWVAIPTRGTLVLVVTNSTQEAALAWRESTFDSTKAHTIAL
jgi:hypothetical protein